jgi:hypothetical protein
MKIYVFILSVFYFFVGTTHNEETKIKFFGATYYFYFYGGMQKRKLYN